MAYLEGLNKLNHCNKAYLGGLNKLNHWNIAYIGELIKFDNHNVSYFWGEIKLNHCNMAYFGEQSNSKIAIWYTLGDQSNSTIANILNSKSVHFSYYCNLKWSVVLYRRYKTVVLKDSMYEDHILYFLNEWSAIVQSW